MLLGLFAIQAVLNYAPDLPAERHRRAGGGRAPRGALRQAARHAAGLLRRPRTGELTSRLTTDIGLLQGVLSHQIAEFSRQILALVGGIVLLT